MSQTDEDEQDEEQDEKMRLWMNDNATRLSNATQNNDDNGSLCLYLGVYAVRTWILALRGALRGGKLDLDGLGTLGLALCAWNKPIGIRGQ